MCVIRYFGTGIGNTNKDLLRMMSHPALIHVMVLKWIRIFTSPLIHSVIKPFLVPREAGGSMGHSSVSNIFIH